MDDDERQRKLQAGRAKKLVNIPRNQSLASFQQKRAKGDIAGASKKTQKRKGQAVTQIHSTTQDCPVKSDSCQAGDPNLRKTNHEESKKSETVEQQQSDQIPTMEKSSSRLEAFDGGELAALTGKEQLKQLQQAVEKRNEIIARLSSNLQEALASRDKVQLEAQSLAGQIKALQIQLQQTSIEFLRIKSQSGDDAFNTHKQHVNSSKADLIKCHMTLALVEKGNLEPTSESSVESADSETASLLQKFRNQLEEERQRSKCAYADLALEIEKHQHVLSLLEEERKGRAEEREEKEMQLQELQTKLSSVQSQCLELQQDKAEKEKLNREVLELKERLQIKEDAESLLNDDAQGTAALHFQALEEMELLKEEHRKEVAKVKQLLNEREKELKFREEEVMELKASKNQQNKRNASFDCYKRSTAEAGLDQDSINVSIPGDILMERYLSSAPQHPHSSMVNKSLDCSSQLDISANYSFELNSDVLGDEPLLSISNRFPDENDIFPNTASPNLSLSIPEPDVSHPRSSVQWLRNSTSEDFEFSQLSERREETDLDKVLLNQQCGELRDELAVKERESEVLKEEVIKTADELEEARSRWAQVTEELRQALWELEEEKEKRRRIEEKMSLRIQEHDDRKNKPSAFIEENGEAAILSATTCTPTEEGDGLIEELHNMKETALSSDQEESKLLIVSVPEAAKASDPAKNSLDLNSVGQIKTLQAQCECLQLELEETKRTITSTAGLLDERTKELNEAIKALETTRAQVQNVQTEEKRLTEELEKSLHSLNSVVMEKIELESQLVSFRENLANLEYAQTQALHEKEEHVRREAEMDKRLKKLEQVMEEELEQFEHLLKTKDDELIEEREKWEVERQEKEKELVVLRYQLKEKDEDIKVLQKNVTSIKEDMDRLEISHHQAIKDLTAKHQQQISEINAHMQSEHLRHQASMEEEQKRQISLIKQVTEREHERMISELNAKHSEELTMIKTELRESLEAAHHTELQQLQEQKTIELEALRQSLSAMSELEQPQTIRLQHDNNAQNTYSYNDSQNELECTKASIFQINKTLTATQASLSHTQSEPQESQNMLHDLQTSNREQIQKLQEDLEKACADRDSAIGDLEDLVSCHKTVLLQKEQQALHLEEKGKQLQKEVLQLQEEKKLLKQNSKEEVGQLWTQLESMRASRQELGELKEQLLLRSARVDDLERLKAEFTDQKREIKEQNEAELESLRRYFEQRLRVMEENYREEIALLQLRLVENALEESVLKISDDSFMSHGQNEMEKDNDHSNIILNKDKLEEMLNSPKLEGKHELELANLQSSLAISFKEELEQVRSKLTEHYYEELQEIKGRHALELEQLKAKLFERHLQDLTRVQLEAAQQVEVEMEQKMWCHTEELQATTIIIHTLEDRLRELNGQYEANMQKNTEKLKQEFSGELVLLEEVLKQERHHAQNEMKRLKEELQEKHQAELSVLTSECEKEITKETTDLKTNLMEEKEKLMSSQTALENDEHPGVWIIKQRLESQYAGELKKAKSCMTTEMNQLTALLQEQGQERLCQAQKRFQEEKTELEQSLAQKYENCLEELNKKHQTELEVERRALVNERKEELTKLHDKHNAQLESLSASHRAELAAMVDKLESKHNNELVAVEADLNSKRKADLEALETVFQKTNQAQLEAFEAELALKHQEEKDELEKRMLANMDTVEATYLKEVQALRDEMVQTENKYREELSRQKSEYRQLIERHTAEQVSFKEALRKELAEVYMEKFSAMAAELSHVHKSEMVAQKETSDTEHCRALEALKNQVLELEQQHCNALQELSQSYSTEKEQLLKQHQLQLQELKSVSARELEACRRELEEESSRQRQHFLEEAELLKVKSEEKLQDRINLLKTGFEEQKQVELEDLRRSFASEQEEKEQSYTDKMNQLTAQLQQLDAVVAQLQSEIGCLQEELKGKQAEMETLGTLLQRRERETQEGGNLLKMLTDDLQSVKLERHNLDQANAKFKKVLIEMIRGTIAIEELIGQKLNARAKMSEENQGNLTGKNDSQESAADFSSEDPELTHMLCESLLVSDVQISPEGEEAAQNACIRLRQTVETLLNLLNQANAQLEQTHQVHLSLEEKFSKAKEDSAHFLEQHKIVLEQLDQEAKLKNELHLELHKAEGLLDGYVAEKAILKEMLQQKEAQEESLVEELEDLKVKMHQMQGLTTELDSLRLKHQELAEEHAALFRQKNHLSAGLGEREKALLEETERLVQDKLDLQRQAEKDHSTFIQRLKSLERDLEEQETQGLEMEQHHKSQNEDLNQRVQALEKQLKHDRQFIEDQAVEREHERDEFQQEIIRLEAQLRQHINWDNKGHRFEDLVLQVESLQAIIKDKTDDHASLLAANHQAQRDLAERNDEIDKLASRIRELEQALLNSAENNRLASQLEQELHRVKLREQELTQDKQALEQQQLSYRLQISALQSKLDETKHCYNDHARDPIQDLRNTLDSAQQNLQSKEQEVDILHGQLANAQRDLNIKEAELKHLTLQLELVTNQNATHINELQEEITSLKDKVSALSVLNEAREEAVVTDALEEETLPSALLQEKNQEIEHLNNEIQRLEQELDNTRDSKTLEAELEDSRSQVEHLKSEIIRVRENKQEEEERLHEVISTLQAELATLGPNLCEVSDSQDGDSINPSLAPSPEPQHCTIQEQESSWAPSSLKQELSLSHLASTRSLQSRLKALQTQLEISAAEKESLERLLFKQEEEYRGQGEEFGKRLKAERDKVEELKVLLALKETEVEEAKDLIEEEREKRKQTEKERDGCKAQAEEVNTFLEKNSHLSSLILDLQKNDQENLHMIQTLKTKEQDMKIKIGVLRETNATLERQVQEIRAEVVDMEQLVAEERTKIETLETVKGDLCAEQEVLRRKEMILKEEIEKFRQEVSSMRDCIQNLTAQLEEKEAIQNQVQKDMLTHAEVTLAKADTALRQKENELTRLGSEHLTLKGELTAVKNCLDTFKERVQKLQEEGQSKDHAMVDLEIVNRQLKAECQNLQDELATHEVELACQKRELEQLRQKCYQQEPIDHQQDYQQKDILHRGFENVLGASREEASLSSPEVLRRLECSEDRIPECFHASVLNPRFSEISALNSPGLDFPHVKTSPRVVMETPCSGTVTPAPDQQSTNSSGSVVLSDNLSVLDSLDTDRVRELEGLDTTAPPSPLGSTSSLSAPEWASDGYGSNVSSELGARLRVELEQTERLDAQFVEYLRCRGINPKVNTDSAAGSMSYSDDLLSPELQGLLKKVYQESCRILTLSHRCVTTQRHVSDLNVSSLGQAEHQNSENVFIPDHHRDKSSIKPPMSWQQEKRALQETVIALRELLCRMAQRYSETEGGDGWQRDQLCGQIESQLRTEMEESQKHLKCAHDVQKEQKNQIQSLRLVVEEVEESLRREKNRVCDLQQQLEQERAVSLCKTKEEEERKGAWQACFEQQRSEVIALKGQVEQDKVAFSNLKQELQIEQSRSVLLEKCLEDIKKELENARQCNSHQQVLSAQEKAHLEHLLTEAESRLGDIRSQLRDAHRKLDELKDHNSKQVDDLTRKHEEDATRDRNFISDLRVELEQERRLGEKMSIEMDRLRAELLQSKRKSEEQAKARSEELQREREAAVRHCVALEVLKEQKQEVSHALDVQQEQSKHQREELAELKAKLQLLKHKDKEREEQWERARTKEKQEQMERERGQQRMNNKLCEMELLRQQDQQHMQSLQCTLKELQKEEQEMAAQRVCAQTQADRIEQENQHMPSAKLLERLLIENSDLTGRLTSLSQERATLKHRLAHLERQLRRAEAELTKVTTETENCYDGTNKLQRLYERYLRAESFRKALVYQKRYLLLLLGGFQECEQATLCLIATMGVRPSPLLSCQCRPRRRFRAAVQVVIAISRMKFLTRKWHKAIKRLSSSATVAGHAPGSKVEVLRQQQPRLNSDFPTNRDNSVDYKDTMIVHVPPAKSAFRLHKRSHCNLAPGSLAGTSQDPEQSLTDYIHHLEDVQQRLMGARQGSSALQRDQKHVD